jgi:DNA repair exonuclease SbcCD nuclease subunit
MVARMNEEIKLLMVGDVHVSDRPPSTRTASYREDILRKLIEIGELAKQADAVVFAGDIFHSKKPRNTSHQTVRAVAQILQSYPRPVYIVPGNHDYAGRHPESLKGHPLGTVSLMPNVTLFGLDRHRTEMLYHNDFEVRLWGVREEEGLEAFEVGGDEQTVIVAHSAIFPPGQAPAVWEAWDARAVREHIESQVTVVWYGHIHEPHGAYDVDGLEFVNFGAISRGSLHEEGARDRVPAVGLLTMRAESYSYSIEEIPLQSARPAADVFRIAEVEEEAVRASETNAFVEALSSAEVEVFSVETAIQALSEHPGVEQVVRERAIELVHEVTG